MNTDPGVAAAHRAEKLAEEKYLAARKRLKAAERQKGLCPGEEAQALYDRAWSEFVQASDELRAAENGINKAWDRLTKRRRAKKQPPKEQARMAF